MSMFSRVLSAAVVLAVAQSLRAQTAATAAATSTAAAPAATVTAPAATAPAAASQQPVEVPVTRVVLFSSGVGYFEHNGGVTGTASAELRFETAQINDVLKSLVVYDRGGGSVRTITYPANDPVNRTLRSFEVNLSGDPPMAEILKQIRGARVSVAVADDTIAGLILGVEQKDHTVGRGDAEKTVKAWFVNIITDAGIRMVALDDIRKLEIQDEKIRREMNQALAALVQARDQSKKTVTIHFDGAGPRGVGMGYLVETPVWKTTYRLLLPDAVSKNVAELQAWAIVENQTDNDWENVTLSLVGGRPISYIELLYQPLYISRPVITPTIIGSLIPQTYDNGISAAQLGLNMNVQAPRINLQSISGMNNGNYGGGAQGLFQANGINGFMNNANTVVSSGGINGGPATTVDAAGNPMTDFAQGVAAIADATKIGEMFHYTVEKVSLPRQQSSMIPIIAEGVAIDRLSIYTPSVSVKYAMRGVRLNNRTGKYLLGGPVTVMDTLKEGHSYAGDAKIEDIPPGQSRLLSYAIDQDMAIQVSRDTGDEALLTGSVVKGALWLQYRSQITREYTLQNKGDAEKTVVLEHPLTEGYTLKEPAKALEKTDKAYRFEVKLAAGESKTLKVVMERTRAEQMALVNMQAGPIDIYVRQGAIPAKVREVLTTIASRRAAASDLERKIQQRNSDRAQILQEQANDRENIRVLPSGPSQDAAIKDLTARDADLKAVNKEIKDLQASLESARAELGKYIESANAE